MAPFFDRDGDPAMNPYEVLGISNSSSEAEVKKAYRSQMLQLHPDKLSPDLTEQEIAAVTEKFHNVKDAYEFLISPQYLTARRLYQARMASKRAEYERREAYYRRTGMGSTCGGTSYGYTVRTGASSYPIPPRNAGHANRSRSEPRYSPNFGSSSQPRRGSGMGAPRQHRSFHSANNNSSKRHETKSAQRSAPRGDGRSASGSRGRPTDHKSGRTDKRERGRSNRRDDARHRTRSEPRRRRSKGSSRSRDSNGARGAGADDHDRYDSGDNGNKRQSRKSSGARDKKRRRAKSAPARCAYDRRNQQSPSNNARSDKSLPKEFYCPLTKRVMKEPVTDPDGNTYEREAIERWLRVQPSSPITNEYLNIDQLRPDKELKDRIKRSTGKSKSRTRSRSKPRSSSPTVSGRVVIDSYLKEISANSKLSVSLDAMGICAFSFRRLTFVIEVPSAPGAGFMVYSSFEAHADNSISGKIDAWNKWLGTVGWGSRVTYVRAGSKSVFTLRGHERDMTKCEIFQKTLEYFVEMSLKLHNLLYPSETKSVDNVRLTRSPVCVA